MDERVVNDIRERRKSSGITQEDLARAMGVSRQTIISIERGRYVPSLPLALKIARYFKRSVSEMFRLEEEHDD
jgi:putative transcriptional regulator